MENTAYNKTTKTKTNNIPKTNTEKTRKTRTTNPTKKHNNNNNNDTHKQVYTKTQTHRRKNSIEKN